MGIFDKKRIEFKKPFTEKYRLTIASNIQTGNMPITSKAIIRWEIKVKSVNEKYINIEIITLDNALVEYNNPLVKSMADMNRVLAGMWSELDLILDKDYELVKINNLELLKEKWGRIKSELKDILSEEPEIISNIINLNDKNFESPDVIVNLIRNNEFFQIYFHHVFGSTYHSIGKPVKSKNIFNTSIQDWTYGVTQIDSYDDDTLAFDLTGYLETSLNRNWVKESYKAFTHLDLNKIQPVMTEEGKYHIDMETGKIIKAYIEKKEIAHPQLLHASIRYDLQLEKTEQAKQTPNPVPGQRNPVFEQSEVNTPVRSLIVDD
jgi:hypothetical protein